MAKIIGANLEAEINVLANTVEGIGSTLARALIIGGRGRGGVEITGYGGAREAVQAAVEAGVGALPGLTVRQTNGLRKVAGAPLEAALEATYGKASVSGEAAPVEDWEPAMTAAQQWDTLAERARARRERDPGVPSTQPVSRSYAEPPEDFGIRYAAALRADRQRADRQQHTPRSDMPGSDIPPGASWGPMSYLPPVSSPRAPAHVERLIAETGGPPPTPARPSPVRPSPARHHLLTPELVSSGGTLGEPGTPDAYVPPAIVPSPPFVERAPSTPGRRVEIPVVPPPLSRAPSTPRAPTSAPRSTPPNQEQAQARAPEQEPAGAWRALPRTPVRETPKQKGTIQECTETAVRNALARHPGNKAAAARELGLTREGLYGVLRRMGWESDPVARDVRRAAGAAGAVARWGVN